MSPVARFVRRLLYGRPIVVVSGLPRSGTSLLMQMLQAGGLEILTDAHRAPDDHNPKGYLELEAVKDLDKGVQPAWLPGARGKAVKVVSPLLRGLPDGYDYRVILVQRHLDEVIASQNRMLADRGAPQAEAQNERTKALYLGHHEATLQLLHASRYFTTLLVDYHQTLARPEDTARRINRFLGGRLDERRMAAAADPALWRHRSRAAI